MSTPTTAHIHNDTLTAGRLAEECLWDSGREPKRGRSDRRGWRQPPKLYGLPAQFRVPFFDLDQIQGRRARTIVNNGLAFCETGVEYATGVDLKTRVSSNAQEGVV